MASRLAVALVLAALLAAGTAHAAAGGAPGAGSPRRAAAARALLQSVEIWPREAASISAARDAVDQLIASGNGAADGLKTAARGSEVARLASNKESKPPDFDKPGSVGGGKKARGRH